MNKKITFIMTIVAVVTHLVFADSFSRDDYKFEYHMSFDEIKDMFKGNSTTNNSSINWNSQEDESADKKSEISNSKQDTSVNPEEIRPLAESGNPFYQFQLGRCYDRGEGVEQDYEQAIYWYTLSAEQGNHKAQNNLAYLYVNGNDFGIEQDFQKALYWLEKAAASGDSYACLNVGDMYRLGLGVEQNYKKTIEYYKKAEKLGAKEASDFIGHMYQYGFGVSQSDKQAFKYFKKSAELGYPPAQYDVGLAYRDGIGVKQNSAEAEKWFETAKKNGFVIPQSE